MGISAFLTRSRRRWAMFGVGIAVGLANCVHGPRQEASGPRSGDLTRFSYTTQSGSVSAFSAGEDSLPRVIFIHGTPGDKRMFQAYLEHVPTGIQYVSYDRPGFGESTPLGPAESFDLQLEAILPLAKTVENQKPLLVGHSLGGPLALYAAAKYPDLFGGVLILAGSADPELEQILAIQYLGDTWLGRAILPRALYNSNRELFEHEAQLHKLGAILSNLNVPVMVMHGTEDVQVPIDNVDYLRTNLPADTEFEILEGADHFFVQKGQRPSKTEPEYFFRIQENILHLAERAGWSIEQRYVLFDTKDTE